MAFFRPFLHDPFFASPASSLLSPSASLLFDDEPFFPATSPLYLLDTPATQRRAAGRRSDARSQQHAQLKEQQANSADNAQAMVSGGSVDSSTAATQPKQQQAGSPKATTDANNSSSTAATQQQPSATSPSSNNNNQPQQQPESKEQDQKANNAAAEAAAAPMETEEHDGGEAPQYRHVESFYGHISRAITLPDDCDTAGMTARHENGVLKIHIPRLHDKRQRGTRLDIQ